MSTSMFINMPDGVCFSSPCTSHSRAGFIAADEMDTAKIRLKLKRSPLMTQVDRSRGTSGFLRSGHEVAADEIAQVVPFFAFYRSSKAPAGQIGLVCAVRRTMLGTREERFACIPWGFWAANPMPDSSRPTCPLSFFPASGRSVDRQDVPLGTSPNIARCPRDSPRN